MIINISFIGFYKNPAYLSQAILAEYTSNKLRIILLLDVRNIKACDCVHFSLLLEVDSSIMHKINMEKSISIFLF
jgi:hypothetical protein